MCIFRSPLERKWSEFFTNYGWEWSYSYTKGSPPKFWLTLPTNDNVRIFVTITHTSVRLSDRFLILIRQIALIRERGYVSASTPVLALSDGPFINQDFVQESAYKAVKFWYFHNCIGIINHPVDSLTGHDEQAEYKYVQGPVMIRKHLSRYILYWICEKTGWQYSDLKNECKPLGYFFQMVDNLPWVVKLPEKGWVRILEIGTRKSDTQIATIIDQFLWKPPNGLMVRKIMEKIKTLAESEGLWRG